MGVATHPRASWPVSALSSFGGILPDLASISFVATEKDLLLGSAVVIF